MHHAPLTAAVHTETALTRAASFGTTPLLTISLNTLSASSQYPECTSPLSIQLHVAAFLSGIASNSFRASDSIPARAYAPSIAFQETTFLSGIASKKLLARSRLPALACPVTIVVHVTTSATSLEISAKSRSAEATSEAVK